MFKYSQCNTLSALQFTIDANLLATIIGAIILVGSSLAVLAYRVRQLETNPFFVAIKELQKEQIIDMLKKSYRQSEEK